MSSIEEKIKTLEGAVFSRIRKEQGLEKASSLQKDFKEEDSLTPKHERKILAPTILCYYLKRYGRADIQKVRKTLGESGFHEEEKEVITSMTERLAQEVKSMFPSC